MTRVFVYIFVINFALACNCQQKVKIARAKNKEILDKFKKKKGIYYTEEEKKITRQCQCAGDYSNFEGGIFFFENQQEIRE